MNGLSSIRVMQILTTWVAEHCRTHMGVWIAGLILSLWSMHLLICLHLEFEVVPLLCSGILILVQTFLHTGLFIISHDAMHGSILPGNRTFNDKVGSLSAALYGLFFYRRLKKYHRIHHRSPASSEDPDYCLSGTQYPLLWYVQFMRHYLQDDQGMLTLTGFGVVLHSLHWFCNIPYPNLILFWALPMLLSSLQLFVFGTFLPHRDCKEGYLDHHRSRSSPFPPLLSFLTCYHFGYHWEHHRYPRVPWYRLPQQRRISKQRQG